MIAQTLPNNLPSKICADPLLAALFDLPPEVHVSSLTSGRHRLNSTSSTPSSSKLRRSPDDGVETDTSLPLLHGESISLTDEEFSDAVDVAQDEPPAPPSNIRPYDMVSLPAKLNANKSHDENDGRGGGDSPPLTSRIGTETEHHHHPVGLPVGVSKRQDDYLPRGGRLSSPLFHIEAQQRHYSRRPESASNHSDQSAFQEGRSSPPPGITTHNDPARFLVNESRCPGEYASRGGRSSPPFGIFQFEQYDTKGNKSPNNQNSPKRKKKKKRRSAAIKSLKKLVGRKVKSSSTALAMTSSFDEAESLMGPPAPIIPQSYHVGGGERLPSAPQSAVDDRLSPERLASLELKIGRIRSTIHSLEGNLIATRNELARAHQYLHWATMELADLQREALEAEVGFSNLVHQHEGGCTLTSVQPLSPLQFFEAEGREWNTTSSWSPSTSSDHLHYFTPTSSAVDSEDDSDYCSMPQSLASHDSFLSPSEKDYFSVPILDEAAPREEKEKSRVTRSVKPKRQTSFKFNRGVAVSNALEHSMGANKESNSIGTPSTANSIDTPITASSAQEEVPTDQMNRENQKAMSSEKRSSGVTPEKHEAFIRVHDLALADDKNSLLPLHETGVNEIVNALFDKGFELAMDETERWSPESGTGKILSKHANMMMDGEVDGPVGQWPNAAYGDDVLVWTAKCPHNGHGSQYPMMKGRGIIPTSAHKLVELLLDSDRVKQYNKMSLGRIDEQHFAKGPDRLSQCPTTGIRGELKIVRSQSQLPVVRRPVELRLLLHARRLPPGSAEEEGARYLLVGRSVWETERGAAGDTSAATRCEMLLSINMVRDIQTSGVCELTTITHGVSPGIPISIGKRIGLAAATKYIRDVRAVFEKNNE